MATKASKLAIFIDFQNFQINYNHCCDGENPRWVSLNADLMGLLTKHVFNEIGGISYVFEHVGTWVSVGIDRTKRNDREFHDFLEELDSIDGFIIKYGIKNKQNKEKGVDVELVCQMLMGAFRDLFDVCILLTDDTDFLPVIDRLQDYFGKKVVQAGFSTESYLRQRCYAHIPLEQEIEMLTRKG
jgi:uncharacterized LabA/DUF88 family protein